MTVFAVERSLPGITMEALAGAQAAAIKAAGEAPVPVRYIRSVFMPGDARCFCLFEAGSAEAVRNVNDAAGLPYSAVTEAMDLPNPG